MFNVIVFHFSDVVSQISLETQSPLILKHPLPPLKVRSVQEETHTETSCGLFVVVGLAVFVLRPVVVGSAG